MISALILLHLKATMAANDTSYSNFPFDNFCDLAYERSDTSHIIYNCVLSLILVFGLTANLDVIWLVVTSRELRNSANVVISVLCGSNILMLLTILPLELLEHNSRNLHEGIANLKNFTLTFLCCTSVLLLVVLSYERWCAVVRTVIITARGSGRMVVGVLVLAGALSTPSAWLYRDADGDAKSDIKSEHFDFMTIYLFVILYALPLVIILVFYSSVAKTLLAQRKVFKEIAKHNTKMSSERKRVAWVAIGLVVSFAVCWFPFHLYGFMLLINQNLKNCNPSPSFLVVYHWQKCIYLLNTCTDPISIFLLGSRFRRGLSTCLSRLICVTFGMGRRDIRLNSRSAEYNLATSDTRLKTSTSYATSTQTAEDSVQPV